jgi:hypothetical protein
MEMWAAMMTSTSEHTSFLDQLAGILCRHGLRIPALVVLEAGAPIAFIGGQLLWIGQPLLRPFVPSSLIRQTAEVLEDPDSISALIARLEASEA